MKDHLEVQRRVLLVAYRRFLAADDALRSAGAAALSWFPERPPRSTMLIGDPGSPIRRLHDRRDRALARLMLARQALEEAQNRARRRRVRTVYLITGG